MKYALALTLVVLMASTAAAQDIEINHYTHEGCVTGGERLLPLFADDGGMARVPEGSYWDCENVINSAILSCKWAVDFKYSWQKEQHPGCLYIFAAEVPRCLAHYESERTKCSAEGTRAEETNMPDKTMWAIKRANVRAGPSTGHDKVDLLEVGARVTVVAKIGDWFKLSQRPGQPKRFVYAPLLTESKPARSTPSTDSTYKVKTIPYGDGEYRGPTRNGRPHGHGVASWPDGNRYEGDFVNGKRTGRGVFTWPNGHRYEGEFVDGWRTGRGVSTWADGERYEGDFVRGKRSGHGVYTWADGERYEGEFVDGKRTGRGVYISADGRIQGAEQDVESLQQHGGSSHRPEASSSLEYSGPLWGAIAVGELRYPDETDVHSYPAAIVWNRSSREEAERDSIEKCRELYPRELFDPPYSDCNESVIFSTSSTKPEHSARNNFFESGFQTERPHLCGAYAEGTYYAIQTTREITLVGYGVGSGNSKLQAEQDAKDHCDLHLDLSCRIELSGCNQE